MHRKGGCCCRPYVTTTRPNCSILNRQKPGCLEPTQLLSLAAAQTRSRGLKNKCTAALLEPGWKNAPAPKPPLRLRPGLKNAAVLKNRCRRAEADQARGLLIVLTNLVEAAHGHAWICCASRNGFVWSGEAYFFPAFGLLIVGKEAAGNRKSHRKDWWEPGISHKSVAARSRTSFLVHQLGAGSFHFFQRLVWKSLQCSY